MVDLIPQTDDRPSALPIIAALVMIVGGTVTFASIGFVLSPHPPLPAEATPLEEAVWLMQRNHTWVSMPLLALIGGALFAGGAMLWRGSERGRQWLRRSVVALMVWTALVVLHQLFWLPTLARFSEMPTAQMAVLAATIVLMAVVIVVLPSWLLLRRLAKDDFIDFCH